MFKGKRHYNEFLEAGEKVSTSVLGDRLKKLEELGIISKGEDSVKKSRIRYSLTLKGIDLLPILLEMIIWGGVNDELTESPKEFMDQSMKVQDTTTICAPAVSQYLGISLLENREHLISKFSGLMKANYKLAKDLLEEISWLKAEEGKGAYYLFPEQITGKNTAKMARELIIDHKVALVPGIHFGSAFENHFRISFANVKEEQLKEAFVRLKKYRV